MILCLGEAIVDLVCEERVDSIGDARAFTPHSGGALANVAVAAAKAGAKAGLAGGAGADEWGEWLRARLNTTGVELGSFSLIDGVATPIAFVVFGSDGEPHFRVYGAGIDACVRSLAGGIDAALDTASALMFGSNTLVGEPERALTLEARHAARNRSLPILFDPNIRANRWHDLELARELCAGICGDAAVVRMNEEEARLITGAQNPAEGARALCEMGAAIGVVTRGANGAVMRGAAEGEHPGVEVEEVSSLGAGDAFMGALAAGLAAREWDLSRAAEALPAAVQAGADACLHWGAQT